MPKTSKTPRSRGAPVRSLTAREKRELAAITALPDDQIDTSDILYRAVKQAVPLRLDAGTS